MMHANKQQNQARRRSGLVLALVGLLSVTGLVKDPISPASARADAQVWTSTGSPNTTDHSTAFLLPDGKVLVVGGRSAELYDPSTGTWSFTGSLNVPRSGYTATLLGNGKVLVAGGDSYSQQSDLTNTAELYDPATGEWSFTGNPNVLRTGPYSGHTATLLSNGKVLFAGGLFGGGSAYAPAELYDPATGKWSLTGNTSKPRSYHQATLLQDGKVLVAGGWWWDYFLLDSTELYDPNTETWSITGSLNEPRDGHTLTTLPNGNALLFGGQGWIFPLNTAELYNPATGLWSYTGSPRNNRSGQPVTLLPIGQVLVVGGWYGGVELYNPATGKWNTTASPNTVRGAGTATLLSDGNVLVVGGQSAEIYHPGVLDPAPTAPRIIEASVVKGIKLFITGENFHDGAVILLNGEEQKSKNDEQYPGTNLIGKKAGKKIKAGDLLQVRNPDGTLSAEFIFTGS